MFHIYADEMIRRIDGELREKSLRRFWWRHARPEPESIVPTPTREAEVIELVFGAQCEAEEPIGA